MIFVIEGDPQRPVEVGSRHRQVQLVVHVEALVAADERACHVDRAEGALVEAAHRAEATAVEVLEDRVGPPVEAVPVAELGVDAEREGAGDREVVGVRKIAR